MHELGTTYQQTQARMVELVAGLNVDEASVMLPACPEWSVHDVLAHLSGICADIVSGALLGTPEDVDAMTAAQVDTRKTWTVEAILAEWEEEGAKIASFIDQFAGRAGAQVVTDLITHEHDVRGALSRPGSRDSNGIGIGLEFLVAAFAQPAMAALGLPPLEIRADGRGWIVGTDGRATGDLEGWRAALLTTDPVADGSLSPSGTLDADPFELFRAMTGRRSAAQIKSYDWSVDPGPYVPIFGFGPFRVREDDLGE